jgi:hypothetical protein
MRALHRRFTDFFGIKSREGDSSIGNLLLRLGFITRDQLREALVAKMAASQDQLLGEVLIARGALTRSQLDRVVLRQRELRGEAVDYFGEAAKLAAKATAQAESLHGSLDEVEKRANALALVIPIDPSRRS